MERVGGVGIGNMGMAKNLIENGYQVIAYDVRKDRVDEIAAFGAIHEMGSIYNSLKNTSRGGDSKK
jgi:3-hydroxyisobutyrate dehydrogenase-like beta-hydroxyacid dehydrogenase